MKKDAYYFGGLKYMSYICIVIGWRCRETQTN